MEDEIEILNSSEQESENLPEDEGVNNDKIIINGLIGIIGIILGLYLESRHVDGVLHKTFGHFFRDVGIGFLTAAIITHIIEMPNLISFFKERIIDALKDNRHLNNLSNQELESIKEKCNNLLFLNHGKRRNDVYLNESLMEFENEIFKSLMKPFYEYFIITMECTDYDSNPGVDFPGDKCIKKLVRTNFKIVNPLKGQRKEKILNPMNFYCPDDFINCEKLVKIKRFRVKLDKGVYEDITTDIEVHVESLNSFKHPNYNKRFTYKRNGEEISFSFSHELSVELEEERYVPISDKIYTKRVNKPTKNLTINYTYNNPDFNIKADCFATLPDLVNDNLISTEYGNSVFIESKSWLLPGNGILIAIVPKENV